MLNILNSFWSKRRGREALAAALEELSNSEFILDLSASGVDTFPWNFEYLIFFDVRVEIQVVSSVVGETREYPGDTEAHYFLREFSIECFDAEEFNLKYGLEVDEDIFKNTAFFALVNSNPQLNH